MTRTEETESYTTRLLALAEEILKSEDDAMMESFHPETIKQLIELVRLQHEAVRQYATMMPLWKAGVEALAAFNKFEQRGK